ncbi:hypothetical protein AFCDBAGC_1267 [Methylobacterium cerastii]|uniref:Uncharacterized protein n=1 Tax=Methylobacterium cerastii TaxID=932741 RepID=A0ABQ4QEX4_9HYPH|nr:hypothetical protein AFCDBAGC_1267 [Methylobacterium cerastii]
MLVPDRVCVPVLDCVSPPLPETIPAKLPDPLALVIRVWPEAIATLLLALPPVSAPMISDVVTRNTAAVPAALVKVTVPVSAIAAPPCSSSVPAEIVVAPV